MDLNEVEGLTEAVTHNLIAIQKLGTIEALKDLIKGEVITNVYTKVKLKEDISIGQWVHTHNIKTNLDGIKEYTFNQKLIKNSFTKRNLTFKGYKRRDGNVGIRNELWVVPTVGCVNAIGDDHVNTRTILGNAVKHTNNGGVLVLGLGCKNNTMAEFKKSLGEFDEKRVKFLISQEVSDEIEEGASLLVELYENMKRYTTIQFI